MRSDIEINLDEFNDDIGLEIFINFSILIWFVLHWKLGKLKFD